MAEKKTATKKVATKKVAAPAAENEVKAPAKKTCAKKTTKSSELYINAMSVGFRAGDVYQTLAAAQKSMTVAEIAKAAKLTEQEVLLGIGWLFKEGKVVGENVADMRLA